MNSTYDCQGNTTESEYVQFVCFGITKGQGDIFVYLCIGIVIFGLIGNTLCAIVLAKVQKIYDGVRLLRYLTIADMLVLLLLFVPDFTILLAGSPDYKDSIVLTLVFNLTTFVLFPAGHTVYTFEVYLTVLIALQRSMALAVPLRFKNLLTDSVTNKMLVGITVFSVTFNIPYWIVFRPRTYWYSDINTTLIKSFNVQFYDSRGFTMYREYFLPVFRCGIPMTFLVVCNIVLIVSRRRMPVITHSRDRIGANQLTAIVIAITVMSSLLHILWICSFLLVITPQSYQIFLYVVYFRVLMFYINSSTNFIFYCTFGKEFRRKFSEMFKRNTQSAPEIQLENIA